LVEFWDFGVSEYFTKVPIAAIITQGQPDRCVLTSKMSFRCLWLGIALWAYVGYHFDRHSLRVRC